MCFYYVTLKKCLYVLKKIVDITNQKYPELIIFETIGCLERKAVLSSICCFWSVCIRVNASSYLSTYPVLLNARRTGFNGCTLGPKCPLYLHVVARLSPCGC